MSLSPPDGGSIHANALVLGETGVLIRGPSGSGKSGLSLELIALAHMRGDFASLVADDRVLVESRNGRLLARPHPQIAGMIEARGMGVLRRPHEPGSVIHALVDLTTAARLARVPENDASTATLLDVSLPRRFVAIENMRAAILIMEFIQRLGQI
jgi:HPr kinase/phosphorylase